MHGGQVKRVDGGKAVTPERTAVSGDSLYFNAGAADAEPQPRRSRRPTVRTVYAPQVIAHNDWANSRRAARLSYPLRSSVAWQKSEPGGHMADDDRGRFRATALRKWAEGRTMFTRAGTREADEFRDDTDRAPHCVPFMFGSVINTCCGRPPPLSARSARPSSRRRSSPCGGARP